MKFFLSILLFCAYLDASSSEDDDLSYYFNVNIVTGHLELDFQDTVVERPVPFALSRTYASSETLATNKDGTDLFLKSARQIEQMFQGG